MVVVGYILSRMGEFIREVWEKEKGGQMGPLFLMPTGIQRRDGQKSIYFF